MKSLATPKTEGSISAFIDKHYRHFNAAVLKDAAQVCRKHLAIAQRPGWLSHIAGMKYFNVFGPNEDHKGDMRSLVHKSYARVLETGVIRLFKSYRPEYADGEQKRDFLYVKDAVAMTLHLGEKQHANGLFNLGSGRAHSWNDLARAVLGAMGREPRIEYVEMPEVLRGKYQYFTQADIGKLRASGYAEPISPLEDAIRDYVVRFQGCEKFNALVARAAKENWRELEIGDRVATVGLALVGTPYQSHTLEIDDRIEAASVNFTGLDCWTFFETSLAFARMLEEPRENWTPETVLHYIELDRYRGGQCTGSYLSRLHYLEDWAPDNESRGLVKELTRSLGGVKVPHQASEMTHGSTRICAATLRTWASWS
jgi:hypothetical protein